MRTRKEIESALKASNSEIRALEVLGEILLDVRYLLQVQVQFGVDKEEAGA